MTSQTVMLGDARAKTPTWRRTGAAAGVSLCAHVAVLAAAALARFAVADPPTAPVMIAALVPADVLAAPGPPLAASAPAAGPSPPKSLEKTPPKAPRRQARTSAVPSPITADPGPKQAVEIGEAALTGAGTADAGPSPRGCELTRRVQAALRRDTLVASELAGVRRAPGGRGAFLVWDGDWVRSNAQDGKGLAAVREAISWEVGFAPAACRSEPVHGLVVLSLGDGPAPVRLALGAAEWRWSDLLIARGTPQP